MLTAIKNIARRSALLVGTTLLVMTSGHAASLDLYQVPLFLTSQVDPNVLINMSVETPMGGAAYNDQSGTPTGCTGRRTVSSNADIGTCYFATTEYLGYFNPNMCYTYSSSSSRFNPSSATTATHTCTIQWSGNFLNWATMTAIDMFIKTMAGGNRVTDTTSLTVVRRARKQNNNSWFPRKVLDSSINVAPSTVTPFSNSTIYIHNTDFGFQAGTSFSSATGSSPDKGSFNVDVKVCDSAIGIESNCVAYGSSPTYYKPEGLIQANATTKRFGVMSYTLDGTDTRGGGVLRSNMKYVGPKLPDGSTNPAKEYGTNGLLINNPDSAGSGLNSGVINYINQFSTPGYKSLDPIAELFYEGVRYFKHLGPTPEYYSGITRSSADSKSGGFWFAKSASDWDDPILYRCQKNFVVAINDANPWYDKKLPGTFFTTATFAGAGAYSAMVLGGGDYGEPSNPDADINVRTLTNKVGDLEGLNGTSWVTNASTGADGVGGGAGTYDNSCDTAKTVNLGEVMGTCPAPQKQNSYYIAGLAYYANTNDLRTDIANDVINGKTRNQTLQSFFIDTQEYNANPLDGPKNMLWLAGKYGGFVDANQDATPQTDEWDADGDGVPDNYVLATQPQALVTGLSKAFAFIDTQITSASSAAVNSGRVSSSSKVYQAQFNSGDWTGHLYSYVVNTDGSLDTTPEWDAGTNIPAFGSRNIFTVGSETTFTPKAFTWAGLSTDTTRTAQLGGTATAQQNMLNYLRGDASLEASSSGPYRSRSNRLGDIINSTPTYVGAPSANYSDSLEASSYSAFTLANQSRTKAIYVGANDGMLHAFNAANGNELFAFIPSPVFGNLSSLANNSNFSHRYYVDGSPNVRDAYISGAWRSVLVGGLNSGGKGVYPLNVTNPATFNVSRVLWEFTSTAASPNGDADMGYSYSQPAIVRVKYGAGHKWVAIFGNGYNNTGTGHAVLYVVDLANGNLIKKLDTNQGNGATPNGLGTAAVIDVDGDTDADYVYAGDLLGNMWKFDIRDTNTSNWKISYGSTASPEPLFIAKDSNGNRQPITSRPEVSRAAQNIGYMVLFGTGKWIELADKSVNVNSPRPQTFYGVYDPNTGTSTDALTDRTALTQQVIIEELTVSGNVVRQTSANAAGLRGWYIDLISPSSSYSGERVVSNPILRNGRVIFTTLTPDSDVCGFGGNSWVMELNLLSGARLATMSPVDIDGDGYITDADFVTFADGTTGAVGGFQTTVGIVPEPGVLTGESNEFKYLSGSSGAIQTVTESGSVSGRQSWREVR